jgi:hypothetical protein
MGDGKRVVDEDVAEAGESASECCIVFFFARMKACVVHQEDVTRHGCGDRAPMKAVFPIRGHELYRPLQALLEPVTQRGERILGDDLASGPLEVGEQDYDRPLVRQFRKRRNGMTDARIVGDATVFHRHVEIGTDDHPLSGNVDPV